jgi:hypothetical protein
MAILNSEEAVRVVNKRCGVVFHSIGTSLYPLLLVGTIILNCPFGLIEFRAYAGITIPSPFSSR